MKNPLRLIDKRSLSIMLISISLLTIAAVIAIVLGVYFRDRSAQHSERERLRQEQRALASSTGFGMEDFYLNTSNQETGIIYPLRRSGRYWSQDEVEFYWIDPAEAGLATLSEKNDRLIFDSLGIDDGGETP